MDRERRGLPRTYRRLVVFLATIITFLLSAPGQVMAQEADTLAPAEVVSAKLPKITRPSEEVRLSEVPSTSVQVADIIRRFTGVQLKDYGGAGGLKTVNVRSLGSEHVGIFIDGIQVDNAQNMQVDLGRFSPESFETVELYSAAKATRLQTAKEYVAGAAIYLNSARPQKGVSISLKGGSLGTINPSLRWDQPLGALTLRTSAEFLRSSGKYRYPYFDAILTRENGDITSLRVEAQLSGQYGRSDFDLHIYGYGSERGFPGPVIRRAESFPFSAERQADQDIYIQGHWKMEWTGRYSTALRVKYSNNYLHYNTHPEKNPMALPYDLHYRQQSGYLSLAQSFIIAKPVSVDLSADLQRNALDSDVGQFVTPRRTTLTAVLAARGIWDRLRAAAHIAYTGAWDQYDSPSAGGWSRENSFRGSWMPSASLWYSPFKWLEINAFVKKTYRLPSFNDLYYSLMGNARLESESAFQTGGDIWLRTAVGRWSLEGRVSPYYNKVKNKIVAIPTLSQFRWTMLNVGIADIAGLETKASALWQKGSWKASLTLRYTFQSALDHSTPGSLTWGNQLPYIPRHSGAIAATLSWRKWTLTADTSLTGGRWSRSANTSDYYISPWSATDLGLSREIPIRKTLLALALQCSNIFNARYEIVQGYPMPGAGFLLWAKLSF